MIGPDSTGTCTCPANTAVIIYCREGDLLVVNSVVGVMRVFNLDDIVTNLNMFSVFADDIVLIGDTSRIVTVRPSAMIHVVLCDSRFSAS